MKNAIIFLTLLCGLNTYAQVGVNTSSPRATLDITAINSTGTTTNVDGILVPVVDRQRAQSMRGITTSTLIYVNDISTGTETGTAANISSTGYYYYNGTIWAQMRPKFRGFSVLKNTGYGTPVNSISIYAFSSKEYDTDNWFSLTTNQFQPTIAGYYQINAAARTYADAGTESERDVILYKDGTQYKVGNSIIGNSVVSTLNCVVYMNGTTDYLDLRIYSSSASNYVSYPSQNYFQGYLIGE